MKVFDLSDSVDLKHCKWTDGTWQASLGVFRFFVSEAYYSGGIVTYYEQIDHRFCDHCWLIFLCYF